MNKLAIITTHPIQYNAPLYAMLQQRGNIAIKVFYTWGEEVLLKKYDPGFDKTIKWDIPLLEGYQFEFVKNIATNKGSHHFKGIDNPTLIHKIEQWNTNAILVYGWCFRSHLKVLRYFHNKIPVLFRGDSTLLKEPLLPKKIIRSIFLKWVYSKVNFALYVGSRNKEYYQAWGLKPEELVFAPHAIDNNRFMYPDAILNEQAFLKRKELGIATGALVFLFAGKLDDNKNVQLLLDAFIDLNNAAIHLLIAGNGVSEKTLQSAAAGKTNIHFLPFQNQKFMPVLYRIGTVLVLPSLTETWGLSVNEAMACSRPVVMSDSCGAATDLVKEGKNGYTFSSGNKASLIQKMQHIQDHHEALEDWGKVSLEIIKDWNYAVTCEVIESIVKTAATN